MSDSALAVVDDPRQALKQINGELEDARSEQPKLEAKKEEVRSAWLQAGRPDHDSPEFKAAEQAVKTAGENSDKIASLDRAKVLILESLSPGAGTAAGITMPGQDGPASVATAAGWDSFKLFSREMPGEGVPISAHIGKFAESKARLGEVRLGEVISREELAASLRGGDVGRMAAEPTATENQRRGPYLGLFPQLRRRLRILDLLPMANMDGLFLPYTKEEGTFGYATGVKEAAAKPEASITFTDAEAVARTIAVYQKIRKQILSDVPALRGIIDDRLRFLLELKLEEEVLTGKGTDPELSGILHTTGLGVVKYNASTLPAEGNGVYVPEQVLRAITTVFLANAEPDGIVMAPVDWQNAMLSKFTYKAGAETTGGSGEFVGGGPFSTTPTTLWGVPLIVSSSMKEAEVLVADFRLGGQLFIREGINVAMSDSDQDDFIKNKLTLLAEMRAALAVYRPAAFCKVWLTKAAEEAGN
jgi:HK97 family phage major capsid protein